MSEQEGLGRETERDTVTCRTTSRPGLWSDTGVPLERHRLYGGRCVFSVHSPAFRKPKPPMRMDAEIVTIP